MTKITHLKTMLLTLLLCLVGVSEMQAYKVWLNLTVNYGGSVYASRTGGTYYGSTYQPIDCYDNGQCWLSATPYTGYHFVNWTMSTSDCAGYGPNNSTDSQITAWAWANGSGTYSYKVYANFAATNYILYFNANGGLVPSTGNFKNRTEEANTKASVGVTYDSGNYYKIGSDCNPSRYGYTFQGWYTEQSDGTQVYGTDGYCTNNVYWSGNKWKNAGNATVYAHWAANSYTVSFEANGGTCSETTKSVTYAAAYGKLPTPENAGYTFAGWYNGDTKVDSTTNYYTAGNSTLTAHWTEKADTLDNSSSIVYKENTTVTENDVNVYIEKATEDKPMRDLDLSKATVSADEAEKIVENVRNSENTNVKNAFVFLPQVTGLKNSVIETPNVITVDETTKDTVCHELNLVDNTPMVSALIGKKFTAETATYTRPNLKSDWGTICLPYPVKSDNEIQYYKLKKVNGSTMSFEAVNEEQAANTPLVFKRKNSKTTTITPTKSGAEISVQNSRNVDNQEYYLVGTYTPIQLDNSRTDCFYIASNQFWCTNQAASKVTIPAYRAYFTTTDPNASGAKAFSIAIWDGDSTTAIGTIDAKGDIQITDGKYMQDGKVVIVKNGKKYNTAGQLVK